MGMMPSRKLFNPTAWKRYLFFLLSNILLFFIPMILIALMVKLTSKGPALYWPERIEKENCLVPGVTGWVKINGRDELSIPVKVQHDEYYLHHQSFGFDLYILTLTIIRVACRSGVAH